MVIIASSESYSDANRLAEYHRTYDAMSVLIVNPEQIYNEFSSGTPDATAYRWLMKMWHDRAGEILVYAQIVIAFWCFVP